MFTVRTYAYCRDWDSCLVLVLQCTTLRSIISSRLEGSLYASLNNLCNYNSRI